jgi:hypothetical protein
LPKFNNEEFFQIAGYYTIILALMMKVLTDEDKIRIIKGSLGCI